VKAALGFVLSLLMMSPAAAPGAAGAPAPRPAVTDAFVLRVHLPKKTYHRSDDIGVEVALTNQSGRTLFVRRFVGWGESSSVSIWIHGLSGESVSSDFLADELDPPVTSPAEVEELKPGASKRFTLNVPLAEYDLKQGKSYALTVVYHSSISSQTQLALPLLTAGHPRISGSSVFAIK
jgi:hypothetical protein